MRRLEQALAVVGFAALIVLHVDFWRPQRPDIWLGWIPEELGYRLVWIAASWLYLLFFCGRIWRGDE